ncbi:MAG: hydrogenase maturation nickel metallochaperone HypA [Bacteroidota bacterium]
MHEISLVRNVFRSLEDQFSAEELEKIKAIHLKIGLLANVEPVLLRNAYEAVTATDQPGFKAVSLEIEMVPAEISCPSCGKTSIIENYHFKCSHCNQPSNNLIRGTELLISGVDMD